MSRKAKLTQTVLRFIARDDSAIGVPEEKLKERYEAFLREQDLEGLEVKEADAPAWYRLRPFRTENWAEVLDAFAAVSEVVHAEGEAEEVEKETSVEEASEERKAPTSDEMRKLMTTHRHHVREAVRDRIVGVIRHPLVVDVDAKGVPDIRLVTWETGTPQPEGLVEDILLQDELVSDMFTYLLHAAMLTERKKKL